jgi:hypothetical protein
MAQRPPDKSGLTITYEFATMRKLSRDGLNRNAERSHSSGYVRPGKRKTLVVERTLAATAARAVTFEAASGAHPGL